MLSIIKSRIKEIKASGPLKEGPQAAVLIPCFEKNNELYIVMTERSRNLPSHAGEVAFPGGKKENDDQSLVDTAIRESLEEINLNPQDVKIIGELNTLESRFGLSVTPFVAEIKADLKVGKTIINETYTSLVIYYKEKDKIIVTNLDGPLKHLKNEWNFKEVNNATQLEFFIDFELKNPILNSIMKKSFELGLNKIAKSFEERAIKLYK